MPLGLRFLREKLAPSWLTDGEGGLVGYSLDVLGDAFIERVRLGLMARLPQNNPQGTKTAPPDALLRMGRDRRVVRGLTDTDQVYAARLVSWLDGRGRTGNPWALLKRLSEYLGPGPAFRTVDVRGNWFSRDADGAESCLMKQANWDWDGDPDGASRWSRFWVIIYPNGLFTEGPGWGDGDAPNWGDPDTTWGSTATPEQVTTIRGLVKEWKPEGTRCINIILAFDPDSFDPTAAVDDTGMPAGLWEHWSRNVGGVQVPARLETARYWDGVY